MASPSMEDLYHKSCALAEDPQELRDGFQHPARLVKVNMPDTLGNDGCYAKKGRVYKQLSDFIFTLKRSSLDITSLSNLVESYLHCFHIYCFLTQHRCLEKPICIINFVIFFFFTSV